MTPVRRRSSYTWMVGAVAAAWMGALGMAQDRPPTPIGGEGQTTFRSGVDLIRLDVTVLDRNRQPVRGLTAADFTILEDGASRPIATFAAVELPPPAPASAPWIKDVAADVTTNAHVGGHALVIIIDDGSLDGLGELWGVVKSRTLAKAALDELGPEDVASVVFTTSNHTSQDFTADRRLLLAAIEGAALFPALTHQGYRLAEGIIRDFSPGEHGGCYCGECSPGVIGKVAESLRPLTQQRKTILYIGAGQEIPRGHTPTGTCSIRLVEKLDKALRDAQLSNITVHAINANGLCSGGVCKGDEFVRTVAETTGGRAVVADNDPELKVPSIFEESRSYYLLGFVPAPSKETGTLHPIKVRVNRGDVEVRARSGYYTPTDKERRAMEARAATVDGTIASPLPGAGVPLAVSVAAFADPNRPIPAAAIVLNVSQPTDTTAAGVRRERVEVIAAAYGQETGKSFGTQTQTLNIAWTQGSTVAAQYEVLGRLPLKPGRYALRIGVKSPERNGSVYTYVDVPNFDKEALAVSGALLSVTPAPRAAPANAFAGLMPVVPTARRDFTARDRVSAFLRIYQRGSKTPLPITAHTRIVDAHDATVFESTETLPPASFRSKTADYRVVVPVDRLQPGEHLMRIEISNGAQNVERTLRFAMR